jgi:DNA processing protein
MKQQALSDVERLAWHRLAQSENVGPATFRQLLRRFDTASAALEAIPELSKRGGLARPLRLYDEARAMADFARAEKSGARFIALCEPDYPALLRQAQGAPPLICVAGRSELFTRPALAIVGARNASAIGLRFTRMIARELGEAGFVIVSGLARGIDTAAHEATLGLATIAVVAGGIDHFYPPENEKLQRAIAEQGVLLSEMPMGTVPKAESFPRRNRLIAGLARGTIIVEAALRSGSLTTARFAGEMGRDVFAVPGSPLDPRCEGSNQLIKDGAQVLTRAADAASTFGISSMPRLDVGLAEPVQAEATGLPSDALRARVLALASPSPCEVNDLVRESAAAAEDVMAAVLELELSGQLQRVAGGKVFRLA